VELVGIVDGWLWCNGKIDNVLEVVLAWLVVRVPLHGMVNLPR
jgi:hypothetical protein